MEFLKILCLAILSAVVYGIIQDQVTARICVEYFTVAHPPVFPTTSPTLLAFGWGIIATWWVGFILGIPAAALARWGKSPTLAAKELIRPIAVLLGVMAFCACAAGLTGYGLAHHGLLRLAPWLADSVSPEKHAALLADGAAHLASYASGFLGGVALCFWIWWQRRKRLARALAATVRATMP
ncbi:MAG: hypothetical protein LLG00_06020 [Planctomycetaceae bacterium]|nr:hypothetical protein [Planctomycetaceae bacterium]